ncbi:MAG: inositol monophosphatase [bacterium]|nr:inositol monophosphatase [bacterium]
MLEYLKQIIKEAGHLAKSHYLEGIVSEAKSDSTDVVTKADIAVDKFLVEKILAKYPTHGILSEERKSEINPGAEYLWVIDPIDGTRNFAQHVGYWCVMAGITKNGKPYMGAVYDAINDELFYAEAGKGAFMNGKKIQVSNKEDIKHCFLVLSVGQNNTGSNYDSDKYEKYKAFMLKLMGDTGFWFHHFGSMLAICHLAAGRFDAVLHNSGLYHDYVAGFVIATEAGAKWTNSSGGAWERGERDTVIANPKLHTEIMKLMNE